MKKTLNVVSNIFLTGVVLFFITQRLPGILDQYKREGTQAPLFTASLVDGGNFDLARNKKPLVLVFWATWCGPCEVELTRLNRLIENKAIAADSVLALSSLEDLKLVQDTARSRHYLFPVGADTSGKVAASYKVAGTPTLVFIDSENKISWMTTGLSPSLEIRIKHFLKN